MRGGGSSATARPRRMRNIGMSLTKHHLTTARTLGVAIAATLSLAACATKEYIDAVNRSIVADRRVQTNAQTADESGAARQPDQLEAAQNSAAASAAPVRLLASLLGLRLKEPRHPYVDAPCYYGCFWLAGAGVRELRRSQCRRRVGASRRCASADGQGVSRTVVEVARWVLVATRDNHGRPFAIIDKGRAQIFAFAADGRVRGPGLFGVGLFGDHTVAGIAGLALRDIPGPRVPGMPWLLRPHFRSVNERRARALGSITISRSPSHPLSTSAPAERRAERASHCLRRTTDPSPCSRPLPVSRKVSSCLRRGRRVLRLPDVCC